MAKAATNSEAGRTELSAFSRQQNFFAACKKVTDKDALSGPVLAAFASRPLLRNFPDGTCRESAAINDCAGQFRFRGHFPINKGLAPHFEIATPAFQDRDHKANLISRNDRMTESAVVDG